MARFGGSGSMSNSAEESEREDQQSLEDSKRLALSVDVDSDEAKEDLREIQRLADEAREAIEDLHRVMDESKRIDYRDHRVVWTDEKTARKLRDPWRDSDDE